MKLNGNHHLLLVNAPAPNVVEAHYDTPVFPRTSLAFLAGYVRDHLPGITISVLDCKFDRLNEQIAIEKILKMKPTIIGFTAMTNEVKSCAKLCSKIKEKMDFKSIIGGVHYSALPEQTLREFPCFDYGVAGEGEEALLSLLNCLTENKEINISGVGYLKEDKFCGSSERQLLQNQNDVFPAWDMFRAGKDYMLQTARGCPFTCEFCMNPGGRKVRSQSVEHIVNELKWLVENKAPKTVYFGDEIFTVDQQRIIKLCDAMIEAGLHKKLSWRCQTHVNCLNEKLVMKMKQANCSLVGLGIETGDESLLKSIGKGTDKKKVNDAIKLLNKYDLKYSTFFILGQANETYETAKETVNFAVELNPMEPVFGLMVPYPGTKVWDMANRNEGGFKLLSKDWDVYNKQIGNAMSFEGIKRSQLERMQFLAYVKVFLYNYRFKDFIKFCLKYRSVGLAIIFKQFHFFTKSR